MKSKNISGQALLEAVIFGIPLLIVFIAFAITLVKFNSRLVKEEQIENLNLKRFSNENIQ